MFGLNQGSPLTPLFCPLVGKIIKTLPTDRRFCFRFLSHSSTEGPNITVLEQPMKLTLLVAFWIIRGNNDEVFENLAHSSYMQCLSLVHFAPRYEKGIDFSLLCEKLIFNLVPECLLGRSKMLKLQNFVEKKFWKSNWTSEAKVKAEKLWAG